MLIGMGAMIRAQALKGVAKSTQITNPMPTTPPTISNIEIIRTQVFDIQLSFPVDVRWRLTHALCSRATSVVVACARILRVTVRDVKRKAGRENNCHSLFQPSCSKAATLGDLVCEEKSRATNPALVTPLQPHQPHANQPAQRGITLTATLARLRCL
jgi:hypothetical protein